MTQRQQYAVVPREPVDEQIAAARDTDDFYAADVQMIYRAAIEAAPPPPDQLTDDLVDLISEFGDHNIEHGRMSFDRFTLRDAVRAVLKQLGAKNGE